MRPSLASSMYPTLVTEFTRCTRGFSHFRHQGGSGIYFTEPQKLFGKKIDQRSGSQLSNVIKNIWIRYEMADRERLKIQKNHWQTSSFEAQRATPSFFGSSKPLLPLRPHFSSFHLRKKLLVVSQGYRVPFTSHKTPAFPTEGKLRRQSPDVPRLRLLKEWNQLQCRKLRN